MDKFVKEKLIIDEIHPVDETLAKVGDVILVHNLSDWNGPASIRLPDGTVPDFTGYRYGKAIMDDGYLYDFLAIKTKDVLNREAGITLLNDILTLLAGMTGNATARQQCADKVNILIAALEKGYTK